MTRILLVDDARLFLELERTFLKRTGCETYLANSGEEALRKARDLRPDLMVLDAGMPGLDGISCCRELRADPGVAEIPVLFVSEPEDSTKCLEAGGDAFVARPVTRDSLLEAIRSLVSLPEREHDRTGFDGRVAFRAGERAGAGFSKDLGVGGMFLRTRERFDEGENLQVEFDLPGEERVRADGVVVRLVRPDRDSHLIPGVGIRFRSLSAGDRLRISRFIRKEGEVAP